MAGDLAGAADFSGDQDVANDALDEAFAQALAGQGDQDPLRWIKSRLNEPTYDTTHLAVGALDPS